MVGNRYAELGGVPGEQEGSDHDVPVQRPSNIAGDAPPPTGTPVCRCGKTGFVTVVTDAETGDYLGTSVFDYPDRRVKEAVYPCPACRPEQFMRQQSGCYKRDHEAAKCERCMAAGVVPGKKSER